MHAAAITAFKDPAMLATLVDALIERDFLVFVHIDRRSRFPAETIAAIEAKGGIVERRYRVVWGGYTHLLALVGLIRRAVADPRVTYVHTLSGQDYPIKSAAEIGRICDGRIFLCSEPLAETDAEIQHRFRSRKFLYPIERWRSIPRPFARAVDWAQSALGIARRRTRDFTATQIFKGLVWLSMPVEVARHTVESPVARRFLHDLRLSHLPEEFFFQTVIAHSPFADRIFGDELRYMDWDLRDGVRPAVLDLRDLSALAASPALFARKFDSRKSAELIDRLAAAPNPQA